MNSAAGSGGAGRPPEGDASPSARPRDRRRNALARTLRHASTRIPRTAMILLPVCFLYLFGIAWQVVATHYGGGGFDNQIFISVGQGTLSHGYPFETFRDASGRPFFDHTPLFAYFLLLPGAIADAFGLPWGVVAGRVISAGFGLATVLLAFVVGRDVRGTVSGFVAALLVATNLYFVSLSWVMHMEVPMAFCMVLALYFLVHERMLTAGIAIAASVMLKEHALGFWLVASAYVVVWRGWRAALRVALPSAVALAIWGIAAYQIDHRELAGVLRRWQISIGGQNPVNPRFQITLRDWLITVGRDIIGPQLGGLTIVALAVAMVRGHPAPRIVVIPLAYTALAVAASFLLHLKEDRWLTGVIPMAALAVAMLVDWAAVVRWLGLGDLPGASPRPEA